MRLEGRIVKNGEPRGIADCPVSDDEKTSFSHRLDAALLALCKELGIPLPLWLNKNSREFARFHQTLFTADQFQEKVRFDLFQIRLMDI